MGQWRPELLSYNPQEETGIRGEARKAEGPIKPAGFGLRGPGRRFGSEHLSPAAWEQPMRLMSQARSADQAGASTQTLHHLRCKAAGIVGHLSIKPGRAALWTWLPLPSSKTFKPGRGGLMTFSRRAPTYNVTATPGNISHTSVIERTVIVADK